MADAEDMGAFGASEEACYRWPGDSVDDRLCRAAFCAGGGWAAKKIERLRAALIEIADDPTGVSIAQAEIAKAALKE